jgi:predicted ABC-type ATPase
MKEKNLYIIAGCNGAGKTTASFTILVDTLDCKEFVNADEIAKGLSPFQPEQVSFEAGRIMLNRIEDLLNKGINFSFETTLSTKSYKNFVLKAQKLGYKVTLLYFWLQTVELAIERVKTRVLEGGHNIPVDVIGRRYLRGIDNLFDIYLNIVDAVLIFDNSFGNHQLIAQTDNFNQLELIDELKFNKLKAFYNGKQSKRNQ